MLLGYRVNDACIDVMLKSVANRNASQNNSVRFDDFIRLCVKLQVNASLNEINYIYLHYHRHHYHIITT